jgi:ADP-ribose pyrophosphatase
LKKNWSTSAREIVFQTPVFSLRRDRKQRLDSEESHDFYIIDSVDWVNVIPLTPDNEIVFIELHRHGTDETSLTMARKKKKKLKK